MILRFLALLIANAASNSESVGSLLEHCSHLAAPARLRLAPTGLRFTQFALVTLRLPQFLTVSQSQLCFACPHLIGCFLPVPQPCQCQQVSLPRIISRSQLRCPLRFVLPRFDRFCFCSRLPSFTLILKV